ncbi:hypothetical protein [Methylobacterium trifolii]|uniref:Uncharacterized protein n=1 Tax=Methylobacterium trifolii TaxID=1003092 RepID=A0ABQ4U5U0_9HYPH|nr:hypothetical protein [Methylobacterium trifolii]GJE62151.1 hypothetical protein MPOCJGCO_4281 [Methylobacterium trifolii]
MTYSTKPRPSAGCEAETERPGLRPMGALVPFAPSAARRVRREPAADEPRGEILLFLGVRYERRAS